MRVLNEGEGVKKVIRQVGLTTGLLLLALLSSAPASADRATVLKQIDVPHNYYFREMYLPQVTSGPGYVAWRPDGKALVYSMQGSLWLQTLGSDEARQLTSGAGYDYQPDWSPVGNDIVFVRYANDALELYKLDLTSGNTTQLTNGGAVNMEPRYSPDGKRIAYTSTQGSGRFHVFVGAESAAGFAGKALLPERQSAVVRYYYSKYDHEISPSWSPDGSELVYVSNPEAGYGTGAIWRRGLTADAKPILVRDEETSWKAKPDWSPDGKRVIYSSYLGRQWHQLWITTAAGGGDPIPLSYGNFDITGARWSPNGKQIAYIANDDGNVSLKVQDVLGGQVKVIKINKRIYLEPTGTLTIKTTDASGNAVAARISVTGSDGRNYGPNDAWLHADDGFDRDNAQFESRYFHSQGESTLTVPAGATSITVWRGLENHIARQSIEVAAGKSATSTVAIQRLSLPEHWQENWLSGDVHVHMNYGGTYRNTPARLLRQAEAEDLDVIYNLIVNKEQRIPDISYFSTEPDPVSNKNTLIMHSQEYHTSFWGHLGVLGLQDHLLISDYSSYPNTGAASLFPDNETIEDLAHAQNALVGYVHPFDVAPDPDNDAKLTNALPIDVALGKVDYYEVVGFSNHRETAKVWYRLLNLGFDVTAAAGTDAMANYASLRGPVGMNRVYVLTKPGEDSNVARRDRWQAGLLAGNTIASNGPLLGFSVDGQQPGSHIKRPAGEYEFDYSGFMRSIVPVDHLEVIVNGAVVQTIDLDEAATSADFTGRIKVKGSAWILVRAWNDKSHPDVFDLFPFATSNPVFIDVAGTPLWSTEDANYFVRWIDRVKEAVNSHPDFNTDEEKNTILAAINKARAVYAEGPQAGSK